MPAVNKINEWLMAASNSLARIGIESARLDAELILAHCINQDRAYLHAHPELSVDSIALKNADNLLEKRRSRVPLALLFGYKEFYGRNFMITQDTLIPRPESEEIINLLKKSFSYNEQKPLKIIDVGTGSGCLGITAKLEVPQLDVTLIDISEAALKVAQRNADALHARVNFICGNLLTDYYQRPNIILANLPYVDRQWQCSPETAYEPELAIFANDDGLAIIKQLIAQAAEVQKPGDLIILEADPRQLPAIISYAKNYQYENRVASPTFTLELAKN